MIKILMLASALATVGTPANVDDIGFVPGSLKEFLSAYDAATTPAHRAALELLIEGAKEGIMSAEAQLEVQQRMALYCAPTNLDMKPPQIIQLLKIAVKDDDRYEAVPVGFAILKAYEAAFPCTKKP